MRITVFLPTKAGLPVCNSQPRGPSTWSTGHYEHRHLEANNAQVRHGRLRTRGARHRFNRASWRLSLLHDHLLRQLLHDQLLVMTLSDLLSVSVVVLIAIAYVVVWALDLPNNHELLR